MKTIRRAISEVGREITATGIVAKKPRQQVSYFHDTVDMMAAQLQAEIGQKLMSDLRPGEVVILRKNAAMVTGIRGGGMHVRCTLTYAKIEDMPLDVLREWLYEANAALRQDERPKRVIRRSG